MGGPLNNVLPVPWCGGDWLMPSPFLLTFYKMNRFFIEIFIKISLDSIDVLKILGLALLILVCVG